MDIEKYNFIPEKYDLRIDPDFRTFETFTGELTMSGKFSNETKFIRLNANLEYIGIKSGEIRYKNGKILPLNPILKEDVNGFMKLDFPESSIDLIHGIENIYLKFNGKIDASMKGFYYSKNKGKENDIEVAKTKESKSYSDLEKKYPFIRNGVLSTQFEAIYARNVFPCFDTPLLKAVFSFSIGVPQDLVNYLTFLSNMPIESIIRKDVNPLNADNKGFEISNLVRFLPTPKMSTYLLAWAIGKFEYIEYVPKEVTSSKPLESLKSLETEKKGESAESSFKGPIRVYTTPGNKENAAMALEVAKKALNNLTKFYKTAFPLPKCDLLAIPEFASGAMENWGLITFREICLFVNENSSIRARRIVTEVVVHEIAHMWFGNLVTMKWWSDLWLNEGFATFVEYRGAGRVLDNPDLIRDMLYESSSSAYEDDVLRCCKAVKTTTESNESIRQLFDSIRYAKGGAVLRMLLEYVGEDGLRRGLERYLKKFAYSNASSEDLFEVLEEELGMRIPEIMDGFIKRAGVPLISVDLESEGDRVGKLVIKQERFCTAEFLERAIQNNIGEGERSIKNKKLKKNIETDSCSESWVVPIVMGLGGFRFAGDEEEKLFERKTVLLDTKTKEISLEEVSDNSNSGAKFIDGNYSDSGYYVVRYSEELMNLFMEAYKKSLVDEVSALKFLKDVILLTKAGHYSIQYCLKIVEVFSKSNDYYVLLEILSFFKELSFFCEKSKLVELLEKYILSEEKNKKVFSEIGDFESFLSSRFSYTSEQNRKAFSDVTLERKESYTKTLIEIGIFCNSKCVQKLSEGFNSVFMEKGVGSNAAKGLFFKVLVKQAGFMEILIQRYNSLGISAEEKGIILRSLGFVTEKKNVDRVFEFVLSDKVELQNKHIAICSLLVNSQIRVYVLEVLEREIGKVFSLYKNDLFVSIIVGSMIGFNDEESYNKIEKLFTCNKDCSETLVKTLEKVRNNIMFSKLLRESDLIV